MNVQIEQGTTVTFTVTPALRRWADAFLTARKAEGKSPGTLTFYTNKITAFVEWADTRNVTTPEDITADTVRAFLLHLEEQGHNPGGRHAFFRALRTFLYFWRDEEEPIAWRNPFAKVKAPRVEKDAPLDPANTADIERMVKACAGSLGARDKAIFLTLLDTGLRASELCRLDLADVNPYTGQITVRHGKGNKSRAVFLGQRGRRVLRAYLKTRRAGDGPLFRNEAGERLKYSGLRQVVRRAAARAHVPPPPLHSFRRAFCLAMLRNGTDLLTLQRLMGHADLSLLHRYAKQTTDDLRAAHAAASPGDRL